jgi:hypothetical protein
MVAVYESHMTGKGETEYVTGYQKPVLSFVDPVTGKEPCKDEQYADADINKETRLDGIRCDYHSHDDGKQNQRHKKTCRDPKSHYVLFVDLFFVLVKSV